MLHFIIGPAKSGKTTKIRDILKNQVHAGNNKLLLLVPEQFSFESEREMLRIIGLQT